jgi:RNA polymerase sigma-70 factor (sigma-E family)
VRDEGFRDFLHARLDQLSRVAYLLTGDHYAAEDLLQNALIKVGTRWRRVATADDPDAYVRRILYHEHISAWRRVGRGAERPAAEPPVPPSRRDEADDVVRRMMLRRALAQLTPRQRAVILLRYFEDLSEVDTAAVLQCSVGTVKSQTNHAIGRLRTVAPELAELIHDAPEAAQWGI